MPSLKSINWDGFSGGEDSATASTDALSVPNGFCALLENIEPSAGRMRPRPGSRFITSRFKNIRWMDAFQKPDGGYTLVLDGSDLWGITYSGVEFLIRSSWVIDGSKISSARAGKYMILIVDSEGLSMVIEEKSSRLAWFDAKISNVGSPIKSAVYLPKSADGVVAFGDQENGYIANGKFVGGFETATPRVITHTWVRVNGMDGKFSGMLDGMPSAQIESYENIDQRLTIRRVSTKNLHVDESTDETEFDSSFGDVKVDLTGFTPPSGATHLRIYLTMPSPVPNTAESEKIARGLALRWVADIPASHIADLPDFRISGSDGNLSGSSELVWSTGRDEVPPGASAKVAGGRLFIAGGMSSSNPGRVYGSAIANGSSDQLSRMLSFNFKDDFVDTSTDDSEKVVGMAISHGDLIIFNTKSVYNLQNASLDVYPQCISSTHGAIGGITEINQRAFYLSKFGPSVVSGSTVDDVGQFKSDLVRPGIRGKSDFFMPGKVINGFWHNESWILSDGAKCAALLMRENSERTWRISLGSDMGALFACSPSPNDCMIASPNKSIYALMDKDSILDGSTPFLAKIITNATYAPNGSDSLEAYSVSTLTQWNDNWQIRISIIGDNVRVSKIFEFDETQETGAAELPVPTTRGMVVQGIKAGVVSHWFQCGLDKYIHGKTLFGPIKLDGIPRNYHAESISISDDMENVAPLDLGYFGFDPINENLSE